MSEPAAPDDPLFEIRAPGRLLYSLGALVGHPWIRCGTCGLRSFHPRDVDERFCGRCGVFHERLET